MVTRIFAQHSCLLLETSSKQSLQYSTSNSSNKNLNTDWFYKYGVGILASAATGRALGLYRRAAISPFPPYGQARLGVCGPTHREVGGTTPHYLIFPTAASGRTFG